MTKAALLALLLLLAACTEETAQNVDPVALTPQAVDHFCQMNVAEHEGPKAQIHLDGLPGTPLFFAQVRDAIAYQRLPEQTHRILALWVSDMGHPGATWADPGPGNWIAAETAFFVIGSARMGGMGAPELVPFADADRATAFARANGGRVVTLDAIPDSAVIAPDTPAPAADDADIRARLKALAPHAHAGG